MKYIFFFFLFTASILPQYTVPNFTFTPDQVWKQLEYDTSMVHYLASENGKSNYGVEFHNRGDSCTGAQFTFLNDTLYEATYTFILRGDVPSTFDFIDKKNKGYIFGHGSCYEKVSNSSGEFWLNFTPEQVRSFVGLGFTYTCRWPLKNKYAIFSMANYEFDFKLMSYTVSFLSEKAYRTKYGSK